MNNEKIDVLDHGFIRLVDHMGGDLSIARAARVSYDAAWRAGEDEGSDAKLIRYLMKHRHDTPFEAVTVTFEVKAPIFVFRQWHRHRTASISELSARYRELPEEVYIPAAEFIGQQSSSSKQARDTVVENSNATVAREVMTDHCEQAFAVYHDLLRHNVPRELARSVLPLSTYSHMFWTANLRNIFHFLGLRLHEHAQYEIRVYAEAMLELLKAVAPVATDAFLFYKTERLNVS